MASKKLLCFLFVYFFALGSATYCNDDSDCSLSESCCSDKVCRQTYYNCSYDYQCGRNAAIANASVVRLLVTVRTTPIVALERIVVGESVIHHSVANAGVTNGTIIFFDIMLTIVSRLYRTPGTVVVTCQQP